MKVPFDYDNLAIFSDDERFAPLCEPTCVYRLSRKTIATLL